MEVIKTVTAAGMAGMISVHGWGKHEVGDQSHIDIDIRPPQYVRSIVVTVSGSPLRTASGTVIAVGSANFFVPSSALPLLVKPL